MDDTEFELAARWYEKPATQRAIRARKLVVVWVSNGPIVNGHFYSTFAALSAALKTR